MRRSVCRDARGFPAAFGRKLVALVAMLAVLAPSVVRAGTAYSVMWTFTEENPMCETAKLGVHDGDAFFSVNETPLPTYEIPGAFAARGDGMESNVAEATFDAVLLTMGANDFHFEVANTSGDDSCVHAHNVVRLVSQPLGLDKPLFDVRRDGTAFSGDTEVGLSLSEINPPLARDIEDLRVKIAAQRKSLLENASKVEELAAKQDLLQQLDTELSDLVRRPLDEISRTDLDAILDRYAEVVDPETRAALQQLVDDLKQSVADLEKEMARLLDAFGAQAAAAADFATHAARSSGWTPDDPAAYTLGAGELPAVDVPDISSVAGAFEPGRDPYASYADAVIASLEADVAGGQVAERADFVANVRAWRANTKAIEEALRERTGVSRAETNAFLTAQNRVTAYVRRFMSASDWLVDAPVPADVQAYVDTVLKPRFDGLAEEMKDNFNLWPPGEGVDLSQTQLFEMIDAFSGAMSAIDDRADAFVGVMGTLAHATSRVALGFVPYAGPALDFCECITGRAWCVPSGKELSDEERIFSGIGFGIAGAERLMWRGATSSGLRPSTMRVTGELEEIEEAFTELLRMNRRTSYKTLHGAVTSRSVNDFEKKAAKFLVDDGRSVLGVGDDGVRKMLRIPAESRLGTIEGRACDFISISSGNKIILSEAKGGVIVVADVRDQLLNVMDALKKKGLAGDVGRVELIMKEGATFQPAKYAVKDGYLVSSETGKPVVLEGFNKFIMVIRL